MQHLFFYSGYTSFSIGDPFQCAPVPEIHQDTLVPKQHAPDSHLDVSELYGAAPLRVSRPCTDQLPCATYMIKLLPDKSWILLVVQKEIPVQLLQLFRSCHSVCSVLKMSSSSIHDATFLLGPKNQQIHCDTLIRNGHSKHCNTCRCYFKRYKTKINQLTSDCKPLMTWDGVLGSVD